MMHEILNLCFVPFSTCTAVASKSSYQRRSMPYSSQRSARLLVQESATLPLFVLPTSFAFMSSTSFDYHRTILTHITFSKSNNFANLKFLTFTVFAPRYACFGSLAETVRDSKSFPVLKVVHPPWVVPSQQEYMVSRYVSKPGRLKRTESR